MKLSKKEAHTVEQMINRWRAMNLISEVEENKLRASYEINVLNWQILAKYFFWLSLSCILIAVIVAFNDIWFIEFFNRIFNVSDGIKSFIFCMLSIGFFYLGIRRNIRQSQNIYTNQLFEFLGIICIAVALAYLGKILTTGTQHYALLLILATFIYGCIGWLFRLQLSWICSLLTFGWWFIAENKYLFGLSEHFLGMNILLRFLCFSVVLLIVTELVFKHVTIRPLLHANSRMINFSYLFVSLWLLSIYGNFSDGNWWRNNESIALIPWVLTLLFVAALFIYYGIKNGKRLIASFGIIFTLANIYTQFCRYFWDYSHKTIFFAVLGGSFWLLGNYAEKIWLLMSNNKH